MRLANDIYVFPKFLTKTNCTHLTQIFNSSHPQPTPYLKPGSGKSVVDLKVKNRRDVLLSDSMTEIYGKRLLKKFAPPDTPLSFERFRVGCYSIGGVFTNHRDNDSPQTKTRAYGFVAAINDKSKYKGGDLIFPEIGLTARLPQGTAILFDASLLHGVNPVVSGTRLVLISFLSY